jgi:hypothetical protein
MSGNDPAMLHVRATHLDILHLDVIDTDAIAPNDPVEPSLAGLSPSWQFLPQALEMPRMLWYSR